MDNFLIRDFISDDYDSLMNLWEKTGLGGSKRGDNKEIILDSIKLGGKLLVMIDSENNILIGSSWMTFDGRRFHLHHFGILPEYQGKKLSNKLVEESVLFSKNRGYQIKLEVHKDNAIAINLYKKYGFQYLGDYDVYIIRQYN